MIFLGHLNLIFRLMYSAADNNLIALKSLVISGVKIN